MKANLILVRHGQSVRNLENRFTGWQDVDLSEQGIAEAKAADERLKSFKIDIAFTSVLKRAKHTLQLVQEVANLQDIPVVADKALNEQCYGDLVGLNKLDTMSRYGIEQVQIWRRAYDVCPPGGESLKDTYNRTIPYFESWIKPNLDQGRSVLIVAHGNSLREITMYLEQLVPADMLGRKIATGDPIRYAWTMPGVVNA